MIHAQMIIMMHFEYAMVGGFVCYLCYE